MTLLPAALMSSLPPDFPTDLDGDQSGGFFDGLTDDLGVFALVPIFIGLIFVLFTVGFVVALVRGESERRRNNRLPVLTVPASVVTKRGRISGGGETSTSTAYYVTFELQGGERIEFRVRGSEYGLLAERDRGSLSYQGTRYKGFDRTPQDR